MVLIIIFLLLTVGYGLLMGAYRLGWTRQKEFVLPANYEPVTFISVIIPARNERNNIGACIASLLAQKYPAYLYEIIVVDDHSDDDTAEVVNGYKSANVKCISLSDFLVNTTTVAYKKAALAAGVSVGRGTLVITTDADCTAADLWLLHMAAIYERYNPVMIVAPVIYSTDNSLVQIFQLIDFMSMQGITAAAHNLKLGNMCNGANLAFSKAVYEQIDGYAGVDHIASGDDYLLMMKMNQLSPSGIAYLKTEHAIVTTAPQPDWSSFFQQRIRWSSKSGKYNDGRLTAILLLVYLFNFSFLVLAALGFFNPAYFALAGIMLVIKIVVEYWFLVPVARFFGKSRIMGYFFLLQPAHIAYIIIAGFLGFTGGYKWKGRKVR